MKKGTILSLLLVSICLGFVFSGCETGEAGKECKMKKAHAKKEAKPCPEAEMEVVKREIPVYNVSDSSWDWGRSGYHDEFGSFAHYYGGDSDGFFTYNFEGAAGVAAIEVKARLSAEADNYVEPSETSDVTLYINDVKLDTIQVMHDDFYGKVYTWTIKDAGTVKKIAVKGSDENTLKLTVEKDAKNKHGICIYGEALEDDEKANAIPVIVNLSVKK